MRPPPAPKWIAERDGVAHAVLPGASRTRAACGGPRPDERFAHPESSRCGRCVAEINRLTDAALGIVRR